MTRRSLAYGGAVAACGKAVAAGPFLAALLVLGGCVQPGTFGGTGNQPTAAAGGTPVTSPDGTTQSGAGPDGATMPPNVMTLPSLPFPPGAQVLLGDTVLIGDDDNWTGQVVMITDEYSLVQVVEFMRKAMPSYGWQETAIVRSKRTSITYVRERRFATVRIMPKDTGAEIDIVVAPLQSRAARQGA